MGTDRKGEGKRTATRLFHSFPALFPRRQNTTLTRDTKYCDSGQEEATRDRHKSGLACKFLVKPSTSWTCCLPAPQLTHTHRLLLSFRWMDARAINNDCHSCPQRIDLSSLSLPHQCCWCCRNGGTGTVGQPTSINTTVNFTRVESSGGRPG